MHKTGFPDLTLTKGGPAGDPPCQKSGRFNNIITVITTALKADYKVTKPHTRPSIIAQHRRGILSRVLPATRSEYPAFDLVVRDLIRQDDSLSLLDYALNLSPALRDTITRDVAQNVSAFEPRLRRKTPPPPPPPQRSYFRRSTPEPAPDPLECHDPRESSVQSKASYLLKPPTAAM